MAPVEPDVANSNTIPLLRFGSEFVSVGALLLFIGVRLYQALIALPPSQDTRTRLPQRNRAITILLGLSALSLGIVSYFAIDQRVLSYNLWAKESGEDVPNSIWSGWYGARQDELGWQLGRWYADIDITREANEIALQKSRSFWWTQQQFTGLLSFSIFAGIEGRRRNLPRLLVFAFVLLAQIAGLSTAQNLFFISLLLTPTPLSAARQPSPLWVPHLGLYLAPLISSLFSFDLIQYVLENPLTFPLWKAGYYIVPWLFATGIPLLPRSTGREHESTLKARQSYARVFYWLAVMSFVLHAKQTISALLDNTPPASSSRYNFVWNMHRTHEISPLERGKTAISKLLGAISDHPAVSVVGWDVILSGLSLVVWSFTRGLDVNDMLKCSAVPWLDSTDGTVSDAKDGKHVAFRENDDGYDDELISPKRKRAGRPRKSVDESSTTTSRRSSMRKRSTAKQQSPEADEDYDSKQGIELASTSHGEGYGNDDLVEDAEASALAWGLFALGGLGVVASSVFGAEVRGR